MGIHEDLNVDRFNSPYMKAMLNIMYTGHWLTDGINQVLKPLGLTEPQFNVLTLVNARHGDAISAVDIRSGMIQRESNVTRIVDKLTRRGWVTRQTCPKNRRKVDIRITDAGNEAFCRARDAIESFHTRLDGVVSDEEFERLSDLLDRIRRQ